MREIYFKLCLSTINYNCQYIVFQEYNIYVGKVLFQEFNNLDTNFFLQYLCITNFYLKLLHHIDI